MDNTVKQKSEAWKEKVKNLKDVVDRNRITYVQIAEITGYHQTSISRFFLMKFSPGLELFTNIEIAVSKLISEKINSHVE